MAVFQKIHAFVEDKNEGVHNLGADTLKLILTNTPIDPVNHAQVSDLVEIAPGNGYPAGGMVVTISSSQQVAGTYSLVAVDFELTAVGGSIAQYQYAYLYDDTSLNDRLISAWAADGPVDLNDGESSTFDFADDIFSES